MTPNETAREAGRAGVDWLDFTFRDDVEEMCASPEFDGEGMLAAFEEGARARKLAPTSEGGEGWKVLWTTAPEDYDTFGTETVEQCGEWLNKPLRRVIAHPHHWTYQADRYGSGINFVGEEDPRAAEAEASAKRERWKREDSERAERRASGLAWLAGLSDETLSAMDDDPTDRGLAYQDVREESTRRETARADAEREATWQACRELVQDGDTLIDEGTKGCRGVYGWIPGQPTHVTYTIKLESGSFGTPRDAERDNVIGEGGHNAGSLAGVADALRSGRFRVAKPGEVPPLPVVNRIGHERWKEIRRVDAEGRIVWLGRQLFGDMLVLDDKGKIVRGRKILEAVARAVVSGATETTEGNNVSRP